MTKIEIEKMYLELEYPQWSGKTSNALRAIAQKERENAKLWKKMGSSQSRDSRTVAEDRAMTLVQASVRSSQNSDWCSQRASDADRLAEAREKM